MAPQPYWPPAVLGAFGWKKGLSLDPSRSSGAGSRPIDKVTETEIFGSEDRLNPCHILLTACLGPYRTCKALHSLVDSLHIISSPSYSQWTTKNDGVFKAEQCLILEHILLVEYASKAQSYPGPHNLGECQWSWFGPWIMSAARSGGMRKT